MRVYGGEEVDLCGFEVFAENPSESESDSERVFQRAYKDERGRETWVLGGEKGKV